MKILLLVLACASLGACAGGTGLMKGRSSAAADAVPQQLVSEDDQVRITELRLRGQTQRLTVQPKGNGARPYEILPAPGGQDPSLVRDASGQRVWHLFSF